MPTLEIEQGVGFRRWDPRKVLCLKVINWGTYHKETPCHFDIRLFWESWVCSCCFNWALPPKKSEIWRTLLSRQCDLIQEGLGCLFSKKQSVSFREIAELQPNHKNKLQNILNIFLRNKYINWRDIEIMGAQIPFLQGLSLQRRQKKKKVPVLDLWEKVNHWLSGYPLISVSEISCFHPVGKSLMKPDTM